MPVLSFNQIKSLLISKKPLPAPYSIKAENIDFTEALNILALFPDTNAMLECIEKISGSSSIGLTLHSITYSMGSLTHFLYVYSLNNFKTENLSAESAAAINALFKNIRFSKAQLLTLIEKLSYTKIDDYILSTKCFLEKDLLALVNDPDNFRKLQSEMKCCLYFYFNPQRKWKASPTPLLDMYYFAKKAGHGLGLSDAVEFKWNNQEYKIEVTGQLNSVSLKHLTEHLALYNQKYPSETTNAIFEAFTFSENLIRHIGNPYQEGAAEKLLERYQQNKLTYLTSQWIHHGFGIALFGDYLIYANRGEACDSSYGCKIFKIKDKKLITKDLITKLSDTSIDKSSTFFNLMAPIIDFDKPVLKFPSKKQKHGTCTFVNPKAIIEGMIVLLNAGPTCTPTQLRTWNFRNYRRNRYKHFTSFMRDTEIDELIKDMFYAKDAILIRFFATLVMKIIKDHHGQQDRGWIKDREEVRRALDLYNRLPPNIKNLVDRVKTFSELMKEVKAKYQQLFPSNINALKTEHVKPVFFRGCHHKVRLNNKGNIISVDGIETPEMHFSYKMARTLISVAS